MGVFLLLVVSFTMCLGVLCHKPIVRLRQGLIQGIQKKTLDNHFVYEEFLDIPYAAPPIGDLRFRPPQPHKGWVGVLKTSREKGVKICPQATIYAYSVEVMDEDCLTLDVYVPYGVSQVRRRKLPVMMFIHGGAFNWGSKNPYIGVGLIQRDVIYVAINYRLGVLGFLATGDQASPGNYGLMDQHYAIKWVREYIAKFGGDPDEITIFGESAGAGSVMFQSVAPSNKGLFKRAIAQSGSIYIPYGIKTNEYAATLTHRLSDTYNCTSSSTFMMVNCLRKIDGVVLANNAILKMLLMYPVVDGQFIPKPPMELYKEGATANIDMMMGHNQHEGYAWLKMPGLANVALSQVGLISPSVKDYFQFYYHDTLNSQPNTEKGALLWTDLMTDFLIVHSLEREANLHSGNGGRLYRYLFRFHSTYFPYKGEAAADWVLGSHGEELTYLFGFPCVNVTDLQTLPPVWGDLTNLQSRAPPTWLQRDVTMCQAMMDMWANFAYTGNPVSGPFREFDAEWPLYTLGSPKIFEINKNLTTATGQDLLVTTLDSPGKFRPRRLSFWNELVPKLIKNDQPKPCIKSVKPWKYSMFY